MRDHTNLTAFTLAEELAIAVYVHTRDFPREELFGLTSQMRRAAVSVASNIVEGAARSSHADFLRFLDIAFGSVRELEFQISLAAKLDYLQEPRSTQLSALAQRTSKVLHGLIQSLKTKRP